jgi:hypothetical protein
MNHINQKACLPASTHPYPTASSASWLLLLQTCA